MTDICSACAERLLIPVASSCQAEATCSTDPETGKPVLGFRDIERALKASRYSDSCPIIGLTIIEQGDMRSTIRKDTAYQMFSGLLNFNAL
jgi:hypothetical protein